VPNPVEGEAARGIGCDRIQNVRLIDNEPEARAAIIADVAQVMDFWKSPPENSAVTYAATS